MEIIVEGKGTKTLKPDQVNLNIYFKYLEKTYESALNKGNLGIKEFINEVLVENGIKETELKTSSLVIRENAEFNIKTKKQEKNGFLFSQNAILKFDFDSKFLSKIMMAISKLKAPPVYSINFTIKNEAKAKKDLLKLAYADAKEKALAICEASGSELIECKKVDFKPFDNNYVSNTMLEQSKLFMQRSNINLHDDLITNTFTPEDIEITEKLYCLWISN